jgi:hypothetical protein
MGASRVKLHIDKFNSTCTPEPSIVRGLNDKFYEKRKIAALDLEKSVALLVHADEEPSIDNSAYLPTDSFENATAKAT